MGEVAGLTGIYLLAGAAFGAYFGSGDCNMNEPHLRSASAAGVVPAVAVDRLKTARREWHGRTYYGQITEGYVRWLGFSGCGKSIFRIARTSAAKQFAVPSP